MSYSQAYFFFTCVVIPEKMPQSLQRMLVRWWFPNNFQCSKVYGWGLLKNPTAHPCTSRSYYYHLDVHTNFILSIYHESPITHPYLTNNQCIMGCHWNLKRWKRPAPQAPFESGSCRPGHHRRFQFRTDCGRTSMKAACQWARHRGTPKWMVYKGKSYLNGWFGDAPMTRERTRWKKVQ